MNKRNSITKIALLNLIHTLIARIYYNSALLWRAPTCYSSLRGAQRRGNLLTRLLQLRFATTLREEITSIFYHKFALILICILCTCSHTNVAIALESDNNSSEHGIDLLKTSINDLLVEKILDKKITLEINFNSPSKANAVASKIEKVKDIQLEKFDPKFNSFRTKIIYSDGQQESLSGKYFAYIEIPVAARYVKFGDIIGRDDIGLQKVRADRIKRGYATELSEVIGLKATRQIAPNTMFRLSDLLKPPVIKTNDPVNIIFTSGSISLKTTGTALGSGAIGDTIKVKNDSSGAVLLGEIVNKNTINVGKK